jgi:hypothetical protein
VKRFAVLMGVGLAAIPGTAEACPARVQLEIVPDTVTLSAEGPTELRVIARNSSTCAVRKLTLEILNADTGGLDIHVAGASPKTLGAGANAMWNVAVQPPAARVAKGRLDVLARFRHARDGQGMATGFSHASAELAPASAPDPASIASVRLATALSTLRSGQTGSVVLIVENKSAGTVEVGALTADGPEFVEFTGLDGGQRVDPGRVALVEVGVEAQDTVRPGPHLLAFEVPIRAGDQLVTLPADKVVEIGVTGESEVLTALGVPALFLVPGFLVVATTSLLWRLRLLRKKWDSAAFPLEAKSAEFWVLAVSVSIPLAAAWAALGTDLFDRYGLEDVLWVWLSSVLVGVLAYAVVVYTRNSRQEGRMPSADDDPVETLEKLQRQGLGVTRDRHEYLGPDGSRVLYLLQPPDETRPATWLSPAIDFEWVTEDSALGRRIDAALEGEGNAASLAVALREGIRDGKIEVRWSGDAQPIDRPILVEKDKIGSARGAHAIVHEAA